MSIENEMKLKEKVKQLFEAKAFIQKTEGEIVKFLVEKQWYEFFTINWRKVHKELHSSE